ncbi:PfkB family carbohydrate kinase [Roseibium sediminicola]|uniref:PfkB family carbohydrate kinase n=1 Tax=Roseibium sediminicola TaxID=2933272 RepID=A0ABT0H2H0_9HYPH|nr:PfkB family carbohydrate kinase [Roseibium sp. CAU 1639]
MTPSPPCPVVAIGAIHYDTIAHAREPIRPETSTPARLSSKPGGVATNLARSLVRLDVPVHLVGTLGDDGAARMLEDQLTGEGIQLATVPRAGFATGQYLALHDPSGALTAACVDDRVLSEAPADLFNALASSFAAKMPEDTIWFVDANLPEEMLVHLAGIIGPGRLVANAVSDAKARRLLPLLSDLDCLMLNRGEAAALTGLQRDAAPEDLASALSGTGLRRFVLTSGADTVLVRDADNTHRFSPSVAEIVDVTGAGDALAAGTLATMARGLTLTEAVPYGLAAAALTLASTGALAETLSWDALNPI